jgi:hypothetical protein
MLMAPSADTQVVFCVSTPVTEGRALTVTACDTAVTHPLLLVTVYVIVAVPAPTPVTTPALLTVATELLEVVHTPPATVLAKVMVALVQTVVDPVMAGTTGRALIVTNRVTVLTQLLALVTV